MKQLTIRLQNILKSQMVHHTATEVCTMNLQRIFNLEHIYYVVGGHLYGSLALLIASLNTMSPAFKIPFVCMFFFSVSFMAWF